ncbi:caspase Dronc [Maniola jurtina]|uniref:caspase Dronc n=1 Tax=Maniola jurtina TaxID=191418 RepID=UPI001E68BAEF|nr:caspase Dronc [Maniola jurtina]
MQEEHRKAIQSNFVSLVEQTDLDHMVTALYEKGVFSEQMIEPYKDTNREVRLRKRQLYMDVTRRGPEAFGHLLDALSEAGYWDLVRELDPDSSLHLRQPRNPVPSTSKKSNESNYVSLSTEKKKSKTGVEASKNVDNAEPVMPHSKELPDPSRIPQFHVVKSTRFMEDNGDDIKLYRTRGANRGVLVVFSYIQFHNNVEAYRYGVDVDCTKLKYLFSEMGFKVLSYRDLTRSQTLDTIKFLKEAIVDTECVFIVVSSHGYELTGSSDNDIRCHDGLLIRISEIVEHFNNKNCPALRDIPKVFIFQLCRGSNEDYLTRPRSGWLGRGGAVADGQARAEQPRHAPPVKPSRDRPRDRIYSDILIAHSTLPGNVSYRDGMEGSWYIQALCEVFAARAHDCHVDELFTLVDRQLHARFHIQTSSVDRWGFNCRLYLHPGLYETPDHDIH